MADLLILPPTPPTHAPIITTSPSTPGPEKEPQGWKKVICIIVRAIWNLFLLPFRLLCQLSYDVKETIQTVSFAVLEAVLGCLFLALVLGLTIVESFGESFFVGEMFQKLFSYMKAYVDGTVVGMFLTQVFPQLGEVLASTVFAFVISLASIASMAAFFHTIHIRQNAWLPIPILETQEPLLLDPQPTDEEDTQETEPDTEPQPIIPAMHKPVLTGLYAGGSVQMIICSFEIAALMKIHESNLIAVLSAFLLLALRTICGYVSHLGIEQVLGHFSSARNNFDWFIRDVTNIFVNLVKTLKDLLEDLFKK